MPSVTVVFTFSATLTHLAEDRIAAASLGAAATNSSTGGAAGDGAAAGGASASATATRGRLDGCSSLLLLPPRSFPLSEVVAARHLPDTAGEELTGATLQAVVARPVAI